MSETSIPTMSLRWHEGKLQQMHYANGRVAWIDVPGTPSQTPSDAETVMNHALRHLGADVKKG